MDASTTPVSAPPGSAPNPTPDPTRPGARTAPQRARNDGLHPDDAALLASGEPVVCFRVRVQHARDVHVDDIERGPGMVKLHLR